MNWLVPDWPAPRHVRALSTRRGGGSSLAPYDSLNLADHVGDVAATVARNRATLRAAAQLPAEPAWLIQVHGIAVKDLDAGVGAQPADAAITRRPGRICAVLTADCLPVLFTTAAGDCAGAAHAGWRGLAGGVLEAVVGALERPPESLLAWLGPAIGPRHFEVGAEVRERFLDADPGAQGAFTRSEHGRFMADLDALARRRLAAAGVLQVFGGGHCTFGHTDEYFSHRRDGVTGRQATLIWLQSPDTG